MIDQITYPLVNYLSYGKSPFSMVWFRNYVYGPCSSSQTVTNYQITQKSVAISQLWGGSACLLSNLLSTQRGHPGLADGQTMRRRGVEVRAIFLMENWAATIFMAFWMVGIGDFWGTYIYIFFFYLVKYWNWIYLLVPNGYVWPLGIL